MKLWDENKKWIANDANEEKPFAFIWQNQTIFVIPGREGWGVRGRV